jgi:hypothetical protein
MKPAFGDITSRKFLVKSEASLDFLCSFHIKYAIMKDADLETPFIYLFYLLDDSVHKLTFHYFLLYQ